MRPREHVASAVPIADALRVDLAASPPGPSGPRAHGYVINDSSYRITAVRLRVDGTDPDGQPLEPAYGWVPGDIAGLGGRASFSIVVPANAARYAISVTSFDTVAPERARRRERATAYDFARSRRAIWARTSGMSSRP